MQDPLKQGLKLYCTVKSPSDIPDSNARSTKTRIETWTSDDQGTGDIHSNARSTKTRIETELTGEHGVTPDHSNARSTKTRIETIKAILLFGGLLAFECKIH